MKSYELQVLDNGNWRTDSVYDDRILAETQARQLDGNNRFGGIRVVEEIFHADTEKSVSKTIYRDSGNRQATAKRISDTRKSIRESAPKPGQNKHVTRISAKKKPKRATATKSTGLYWALGTGALVVLAGGAAIALL